MLPLSSLPSPAHSIGLAAAQILADRGLRLALCDIDLEQLRKATGGLRSKIGDGQILLYAADVSDMKQVEAFRYGSSANSGRTLAH